MCEGGDIRLRFWLQDRCVRIFLLPALSLKMISAAAIGDWVTFVAEAIPLSARLNFLPTTGEQLEINSLEDEDGSHIGEF